jgi:hypothetical protein
MKSRLRLAFLATVIGGTTLLMLPSPARASWTMDDMHVEGTPATSWSGVATAGCSTPSANHGSAFAEGTANNNVMSSSSANSSVDVVFERCYDETSPGDDLTVGVTIAVSTDGVVSGAMGGGAAYGYAVASNYPYVVASAGFTLGMVGSAGDSDSDADALVLASDNCIQVYCSAEGSCSEYGYCGALYGATSDAWIGEP